MEPRDNVWSRFYEAEAFIRAETLATAAIGSRSSHEPLLDELQAACDWLLQAKTPKKHAERLVSLVAMILAIGEGSLETVATMIEEAKLESAGHLTIEADPEAIRDTMLVLLGNQVESLRKQLG